MGRTGLALAIVSVLLAAPALPAADPAAEPRTTHLAPRTLAAPQFVSLADAPSLGDPLARVVMVEFSDFHCPFCRQYVRNVLPEIRKAYVDTGKVRYVFRHFPLEIHPRAPDAAVAALCAARQGRFWDLHDRFFRAARPVPPDALEGHARAVGVDLQKWRTCVRAGVARADVEMDVRDARQLGLGGTPGFVLGYRDGDNRVRAMGIIGGLRPFTTFQEALDRLLDARAR